MIKVSIRDLIWSYSAQIFSSASGLITLPLILKLLSPEEVGMNYLMLSFASLVSLLDFGFTPQFSRNITYVFSGAQILKKEGVDISTNKTINYKLLLNLIYSARFIYKRLAILVIVIMSTLGTYYIYYITKGFTKVNYSFLIWCLFSIGTFFNIYYSYYSSLLLGKGLVMESNKAILFSRIIYVILTFALLYLGLGLLGIVIANLIAPFVNRYLSHKYFYTPDLLEKLSKFQISKKEKIDLLKIIWFNAKKIGLVFVGAFAINKLSIFLAGIFLGLTEIAPYGLMIQLFGLISTFSSIYNGILQPRFSSLRAGGDTVTLMKDFAFSMIVYYFLFTIGTIFLLYTGPTILFLINSSIALPNLSILLLFASIIFLEGNHSNFASLIVTSNNVPFVKSALIAGLFIGLADYFILKFTNLGILGLVLVQGLIQLAYANWKWPFEVCLAFRISFLSFLKLGTKETIVRLKNFVSS